MTSDHSKRRLAFGVAVLVALALVGVSLRVWWARRLPQPGESEFLPGVSAFCPVPSPDGSLVAFVRVGWTGMGLGQSNLETDIFFADARGKISSVEPLARRRFIHGWMGDGKRVACSRDGGYSYVSASGKNDFAGNGSSAWFLDQPRLIPSPIGGHAAACTHLSRGSWSLDVIELNSRASVAMGEVVVCPAIDWEWMGSTWDPWSRDASSIAFVSSENDVVVASRDGKTRRTIARPASPAGLATISPDGRHVAFVSYDPTPYPGRSDLWFYGNAVVWVAANRAGARATAVTKARPESCFHLRWLGDTALLFDRLTAPPFKEPRIFRVQLDPAVLDE